MSEPLHRQLGLRDDEHERIVATLGREPNRAELAIGYFTKHGDGGSDMLPLGQLHKSEVRALARELNVPSPIIERTPSAGLTTKTLGGPPI